MTSLSLKGQKHTGFTLIELMIVVAVIGILAAIAYPSYQDSVRKSRRADAKGALVELAQFMERNYTAENRYDKKRDSGGNLVDIALPFTEAPKEGGTKYYDISPQPVAAQSFTLSAAPKNAQSGDPCGTLTLTNTGVKDVSGGSYTKNQCW